MLSTARRPLARLHRPSLKISFGWYEGIFAFIVLLALGLRLWELGDRTMHYDESLHVHYAWYLATGDGYSHSPWMHGPFQVHMTALIFKLFSDTEFTGRLLYAVFGAALVALPYFFRFYMGRMGAATAAALLTLSPSVLYLSRFGRNEILMAVWSVALLILIWRYMNEGKNRYLYISSAVLALAFATKETAYFIVGIFGIVLFFVAINELVPFMLRRIRLRYLTGPAVLLLLITTLTLPQWSALITLVPGGAGFDVIRPPAVTEGGLPVWEAPFVTFPIIGLPYWANGIILGAILVVSISLIRFTKRGRRWWPVLVPTVVASALAYGALAFPTGMAPSGYVISLGVVAATLFVSASIGMLWRWKVWLVCACIFYLVWSALYTSFFGAFVTSTTLCQPDQVGGAFSALCTHVGGLYTGSWQGLSYWITQQDYARANQPWYYYFMLGPTYEFLPLLFGAAATIYYLRKGDLLGQVLSFWAITTFLAYTSAGEKMPWLVVNIAVPFILLSAKFIGDLVEPIAWRRALKSVSSAMLLLAPVFLFGGVYLLHLYLRNGSISSWEQWTILAGVVVTGFAGAVALRRSQTRPGLTMAALGVGVLLLGFSSYVSFRTNYQYDDTPIEMLAYAQGSADLARTADELKATLLTSDQAEHVVDVDYEVWYPLNWYVREEQKAGTLKFQCYKDEDEDGYASHCKPVEEEPSLGAIVMNQKHGQRDWVQVAEYDKQGPFNNLIWFPELYRRPGEDRRTEGMFTQFKEDISFFGDTFSRRSSLNAMLDYFLFRRIDSDWWNSKYFSYISAEPEK